MNTQKTWVMCLAQNDDDGTYDDVDNGPINNNRFDENTENVFC